MPEKTLKQKAVHGVAWYGGSRVAIQILSWAVTIIVARLLSPTDYGLFGYATLVAGLVDMLNELGLGAALIQKRGLKAEDVETVFWMAMASSSVVYVAVWFASPLIATFFSQPELVGVLHITMLTLLIGSLRVISWNLLTKDVDFRRRSIAELIANIVGSGTTLTMAYAGYGAWALVVGLLARQTMITVQCIAIRPWFPRGNFSVQSAKKVFGFGANISAARVVWYLYSNADFLIVGKMLGQKMLGFYTMVFQLAAVPADRITSIVNQVAFPVYSQLQDQPERFTRYFLKTVTLISVVTFPLMAGVFATADVAIPVLLTSKWQPIVIPLKTMCGVGVVMSVSSLIGPGVLAKGKATLALWYNVLCLIVMPTGFLVGIRFGIQGVCWAWMILFPVLAAAWFAMTRRLIGYEWRALFSALTPATLCSAGMLAAVFTARAFTGNMPGRLVELILLIVIGAATYTAIFGLGFRSQLVEIKGLVSRQPAVVV